MQTSIDIMVSGTGEFAGHIVFDIAACADSPVNVMILGRNEARLAWLRTAANARATIFSRPARFFTETCETIDEATVRRVLQVHRPKVVAQAASLQTAGVLRKTDDAWSQLVRQGGLSATAVFQAVLSARFARAVQAVTPETHFINCCFPDVVNGLLAACGLPVLCGVGNVGILSNAFAGALNIREPGRMRILAHYQQLSMWRLPPAQRTSIAPRVWIDQEEIQDVAAAFPGVTLSPDQAFDISGATGVPLMLALVSNRPWRGHVPGPHGFPGGYPVRVDSHGTLELDLPEGLTRGDAIGWNARFEEQKGLIVDAQGRAHYTGILFDRLVSAGADVRDGFAASEIELVAHNMGELRNRMQNEPATA